MKPLKLQLYCCIFFLLLNYPLLSLVNDPRRVLGVPVLYGYLLGIWLLFIVILYLVVERTTKTDGEGYE